MDAPALTIQVEGDEDTPMPQGADMRKSFDYFLYTPLDPTRALEYEREHWGLDAKSGQAGEDPMLDEVTYGPNPEG